MNLSRIRLLILDVDGVLTDGTILFGEQGEGTKRFCVQDGVAVKLWTRMGGAVAIISGRSSEALARRATELGIRQVFQGVQDKSEVYSALLSELNLEDDQAAYVGDDLPDLGPLRQCGFPVAVANAVPAVKREARYVTSVGGGAGAIGEVVELLLRRQGRWTRASTTGV